MKRMIALLLTGVIVVSVAACGSNSTSTETTSVSATVTTVENTDTSEASVKDAETDVGEASTKEDENTEENLSATAVHMNELISIGDYEIMITDVQFVSNWVPNGNNYGACDEGDVKLLVFWNVKNIGKSESRTPDSCISISYGDGYAFNAEDTYHLSTTTKSWVANADELKVLSDAVECQSCFNVPNQVQGNTSEPLTVIIDASRMNAEGIYTYSVRPADDDQKAAVEKQAEKWLSTGENTDIVRAIDSLITAGCDKAGIDNAFAASKDYIAQFIDDGSIYYLDGDDITTILSQAWNYYDGTNIWNFYEAEQGLNPDMSYRVDGDLLIITTPEGEHSCQVSKNCRGSYVLVCDNEEFAILYNSIMYQMVGPKQWGY